MAQILQAVPAVGAVVFYVDVEYDPTRGPSGRYADQRLRPSEPPMLDDALVGGRIVEPAPCVGALARRTARHARKHRKTARGVGESGIERGHNVAPLLASKSWTAA